MEKKSKVVLAVAGTIGSAITAVLVSFLRSPFLIWTLPGAIFFGMYFIQDATGVVGRRGGVVDYTREQDPDRFRRNLAVSWWMAVAITGLFALVCLALWLGK